MPPRGNAHLEPTAAYQAIDRTLGQLSLIQFPVRTISVGNPELLSQLLTSYWRENSYLIYFQQLQLPQSALSHL